MCFWNLNGERVPQIYTFGAQPNLRTEREEEVCLKRIRQKKRNGNWSNLTITTVNNRLFY